MKALNVTVPVSPTLDHDLPCRQCGYNLRGLLETSRCPECGLPVVESIRAAGWSVIGERQMRRIRIGATICVVETVAAFLSGVCLTASIGRIEFSTFTVIASFLAGLPPFIFAAGVWLLATPLNDDAPRRGFVTAGLLTRLCAVLAVIGWAIAILSVALDLDDERLAQTGMIGFMSFAVVCHFALLTHLLHLSQRVSNAALTGSLRFLRMAFACAYAALLAAYGATAIWGWPSIPGPVALLAGAAFVLFGVTMLVTFGSIADQINEELRRDAPLRGQLNGSETRPMPTGQHVS